MTLQYCRLLFQPSHFCPAILASGSRGPRQKVEKVVNHLELNNICIADNKPKLSSWLM